MENIKDRATVIFDIYLKLGRGNYLLIESFDNKPLILKPFEVYYKEYEPLLFYSAGTKKLISRKFYKTQKLKGELYFPQPTVSLLSEKVQNVGDQFQYSLKII